MERRKFGRTGFEVSVLGFGGAPVGFLHTDRAEVSRIVNGLLDRGINLIDTATSYPGSEEAIGASVSHRRDDYVLVSKCGQAFDDLPGAAWSAEVITATVDRSLKRLNTDHLDVMLLHGCELDVLQAGEALGALVAARQAGKVRHVGYSGDNELAVFAAGLDDVAVIETSVNIWDQANIDGVLRIAAERDIGVLAKRPVANGAWKGLENLEGMYTNYAKTYAERFAAMALDPVALGFAGDPAAVWPEIALRFTLSQPGLTCAIVGSTRSKHAFANIAAAEKGPLSDNQVAALRDAFRAAESAAGSSWPGQR